MKVERAELEKKIIEYAKETFKEPEMTLQSVLNEAEGYDSMAHVQFLVDIEDWCGVQLEDSEVRRDHTVRDVVEIVEKKLQEKE